jgi:hypothetical protein
VFALLFLILKLALLKPIFETAKIRTLSLPKGLFLDRFLALASLRQAQGPGQRFFSTEHLKLSIIKKGEHKVRPYA